MYTTHDVVQKYQNRLNKSDSEDYDNLWWYQIEESFYKGMLEVIRGMKKGDNKKRESDEETSDSIDDLQVLLKRKSLAIKDNDVYVETTKIPSDYLYYKRISPLCQKDECSPTYFKSYFKEEANVDDLLYDSMSGPSYKFEQAFHTLSGNKFKVYHNKHFKINEVVLTYYKMPNRPTFEKANSYTFDFKDDVLELFIDEGIKIMAGDLENSTAVQLANSRKN